MKIFDWMRKNHKLIAFFVFGTPCLIVGATKDNPPVVVQDGITLESVIATADDVTFSWSTTDTRCVGKPFVIERKNATTDAWETIATVPAATTSYTYQKFTVDQTNQWRVSCQVEGD